MKVYSGYIINNEKLLDSSSGGVATALSEIIIEQGGVVFGVRYSKDFRHAEYCKAECFEELNSIKGSKYISSSKKGLFEQLADVLNSDRLVLVIGLGCDIAAVQRFCELNRINTSNLYCIDILCHGPAPQLVHESFIEELESKFKGKIVDYNVRYKKKGWSPSYIRALFDNGMVYVKHFSDTDFGLAFYNLVKPGCIKCPYKGDNHKGDICIGDFWGITPQSSSWNNNGVSAIVLQTTKGEDLINMLDDRFYIEEADAASFLKGNPMYTDCRSQRVDYDLFMKCLKEKGLHYASRRYFASVHFYLRKFYRKVVSFVGK